LYDTTEAASTQGPLTTQPPCFNAAGASSSQLAGKPIRLRFVMKDADLFSLRFYQ